MSEPSDDERTLRLDAGVEETLTAVSEAAEHWGAKFEREEGGGLLELPVAAGLRHGIATARVAVEGTTERASLTLSVVEARYQLHATGLAMLSLSGLGALVTVVVPFLPGLLPFLPVGILLAVSGWLLIVARLRMSGIEDFLALVTEIADDEPGGDDDRPLTQRE